VVQYSGLDATFGALADPTRRAVLERLADGPASVSQLAEPYSMSLTGMKKHVQVLEDAKLVTTRKVGRTRICELGPRRMEDAASWIDAWRRETADRLDRLAELVERRTKGMER
jgi:DNA-binding transcriptional ArsR family regulator